MASDPSPISEIGKWAAGSAGLGGLALGLGKVLSGLLQGWISGAPGQEREMRDALAQRVANLESRIETLEKRLDNTTRNRDAWRYLAMQARLCAEDLARRHGDTLTSWPPDPEETP